MSLRFAPEISLRMRKALVSRGRTLATLLADVLAGKQPPRIEELCGQDLGEAALLEVPWADHCPAHAKI